jgi:hypothetical protein
MRQRQIEPVVRTELAALIATALAILAVAIVPGSRSAQPVRRPAALRRGHTSDRRGRGTDFRQGTAAAVARSGADRQGVAEPRPPARGLRATAGATTGRRLGSDPRRRRGCRRQEPAAGHHRGPGEQAPHPGPHYKGPREQPPFRGRRRRRCVSGARTTTGRCAVAVRVPSRHHQHAQVVLGVGPPRQRSMWVGRTRIGSRASMRPSISSLTRAAGLPSWCRPASRPPRALLPVPHPADSVETTRAASTMVLNTGRTVTESSGGAFVDTRNWYFVGTPYSSFGTTVMR